MNPRTLHVVLAGKPKTGKTAIASQFAGKPFPNTYHPTIGTDSNSVNLKDQNLIFFVWDIAGNERYQNITQHYYNKTTNIVMLVFNPADRQSFDNLQSFLEIAKSRTDDKCQYILVENKRADQNNREISEEDARKFAEQNKMEYRQIDATQKNEVRLLFTNSAIRYNKANPPKPIQIPKQFSFSLDKKARSELEKHKAMLEKRWFQYRIVPTFLSLFGYKHKGFSAKEKIEAIDKILYPQKHFNETFSQKDNDALNQGRTGKIIEKMNQRNK